MTDLVEVLARAMWRFANESHGVTDAFPWDHGTNADNWRAEARACLTALESAGYRVVPVEPTAQMLDAGYCDAPDENAPVEELEAYWATLSPEDIWPAMLDAAPKVTP